MAGGVKHAQAARLLIQHRASLYAFILAAVRNHADAEDILQTVSVAVIESLEFIGLWLGGNEAQAFEMVKKTYASTIATANALFADQGQCMMNISKVMITRAELKRRQENLPSPMRVPVEVTRP